MTDSPTVPSAPGPLQPTRAPSAVIRVALALGVKPATADKVLLNTEDGLSHKAAAVISALRRGDHGAELARFWQPIIAAFEDKPEPRSIKALRHRAQIADSSEDLAESLVVDSESATNLRRWARELRDEAALGLELADAADLKARELEEKAREGDATRA